MPPAPPRRSSGSWLKAVAGIEAALVAGLLVWIVLLRSELRDVRGTLEAANRVQELRPARPAPPPPPPPPTPSAPVSVPAPAPPPPAPAASAAQVEADLMRTAERVSPGLIHIEVPGGMGSGFLIDGEGHVVSNAHVVGEAKEATVQLFNRTRVTAKVLARDYAMDLAVLQLDLRNEEVSGYVKPMELGDSDALRTGQFVMALGSPRGFSRSACVGIVGTPTRFCGALATPRGGVSGLLSPMIQTDTPINPGNSGGPLVSLDGKVVGVNTRRWLAGDVGMGLAVPSNTVKEVAAQLLALPEDAQGQMDRNSLGADLGVFSPDNDENAWAYKLEKGVKVLCVYPDSPAEQAGIQKGDILSRIAGVEVSALHPEEIPSAYRAVDRVKPGEPFEVEVQRKEPVVLKVTGASCLTFYPSIRMDNIGIYARAPYDTEVRAQQGAVVTGRIEEAPNYDPSAEDQFHVGDVVKKVNGLTIQGFDKFHDQIRTFTEESLKGYTFEVVRGDRTVTIRYPFEKHRATGADGSD